MSILGDLDPIHCERCRLRMSFFRVPVYCRSCAREVGRAYIPNGDTRHAARIFPVDAKHPEAMEYPRMFSKIECPLCRALSVGPMAIVTLIHGGA